MARHITTDRQRQVDCYLIGTAVNVLRGNGSVLPATPNVELVMCEPLLWCTTQSALHSMIVPRPGAGTLTGMGGARPPHPQGVGVPRRVFL